MIDRTMGNATMIDRPRGRGLRRTGPGTRSLEPDIVGIIVFIVLLALGLAWPLALTFGAAGFAAVFWMRRRSQGLASPLRLLAAHGRSDTGASPSAARSAPQQAEARATIARIRAAAADSAAAPARRSALALCVTAERIVDALQLDPKRVSQIGRLMPYLETAQEIVTSYNRLAPPLASSAEVRATLARVEPALDDLRVALERRLESLLSDEAFDLEVELSVLEKTARSDGWLS
jgi:5-bromo-4-chloroindolyl phosphate hydrolysis protein